MKKLSKGIYLVIDPAMEADQILSQLTQIKEEEIAALQIWDNPKIKTWDKALLQAIIDLFSSTKTPVLINNQWELCQEMNFDGIHFDMLPENISRVEQNLDRLLLKGLTLENDLSYVKNAEHLGFDYFSFCSLFPSSTVDNCEIVRWKSIEKCRSLTQLPIYLAGGINLEKIELLKSLPFDGIAMVSSIMNAKNPQKILRKYNNLLKEIEQ
ncbi:thiamine-phosphate diphosphorylase [Salegentibacter echinorum]|uniref:Thiamine-phosphate diphosphorylase n=1 Tax=Salegentibacter echinorum TaxID=1073325 RepID=A0A1M5KDN7_SALEC|nr:thiamine phosphate synthase [Salegentibacter echinorum]SHG50877.1 thiamine-phosphate diphosphorylase [Salegentibacter echinorum]